MILLLPEIHPWPSLELYMRALVSARCDSDWLVFLAERSGVTLPIRQLILSRTRHAMLWNGHRHASIVSQFRPHT